jgi:methyl-accepting chemotaxis protein
VLIVDTYATAEGTMFNQINNFSISQKLWITAILMVVVGSVVGVMSYSRLTQLDSGIHYIVDESLPVAFVPKDAQVLIKKSYASFNFYLLSRDPHYKSEYRQSIQQALSLIEKLTQQHHEHQDEATALTDEAMVLLQRLAQLNEDVLEITEAEANFANTNGERVDVQIVRSMVTPVQARFDELLDRLVQHEMENIQQSSQQLLKDANLSINTIIYGIPIGILFLISVVGLLNRMIVTRLNTAVVAMQDVALKGDLNLRLDESGKDEISALSLAYNTFMVKIQGVVDLVLSSSSSLSQESAALNTMTRSAESQAETQKSNINEIATSIHEMASRVELVASNASAAADAAQQANEDARTGRDVVSEVVSSITALSDEISRSSSVIAKLGEDSKEITSVVAIIRGISEQTNLLALNAAIEAARAGEAGRGFAVVADEVRNLSERIHKETDEIQRKINALQTGSADAVKAMARGAAMSQKSVEMAQSAGHALESITVSVRTISEMNISIADLTREQKESAAEVHHKTEMVHNIANQTAATSARVSSVSQEFTIMASQMKDLVEQFLLASSSEKRGQKQLMPQITKSTQGGSKATEELFDGDDNVELF